MLTLSHLFWVEPDQNDGKSSFFLSDASVDPSVNRVKKYDFLFVFKSIAILSIIKLIITPDKVSLP